ncbi:MAG: VOC family protein [Acidobacteria bacterium]|nr:VOC family protein [Acidobacteriota bacterium]
MAGERKSAAGGKAQKTSRKTARPKRPAAPAKAKRAARPRPEPIVRARPETLRLRSISAGLTVDDLERSLQFYSKGLGFFVQQRWEKEGALVGVMLRAGTCELAISQDDWTQGKERRKGQGVRLWLETVQDLDALAERAESFGAVITDWPADRDWGVRSFSLDDPNGFHLTFFTRKAE